MNSEQKRPLGERLRDWKFYRDRFVEVVAAMAMVFFITAGLEKRDEMRRDHVPPSDWFVVHEIFVPDHTVGSNPSVLYDRTIKRNFRGFWVSEVQRRDREIGEQNFSACTGHGTADYETVDVIPDKTVSWEWFHARECKVPPGTYRVVVTYDMQVPGYPVKRTRAISNAFTVYDQDALEELRKEAPIVEEAVPQLPFTRGP